MNPPSFHRFVGKIMMKSLAVAFLIISVACAPAVNDEGAAMNTVDKVLVYKNGSPAEVRDTKERERIVEEVMFLLSKADDIYLKAVAPGDIEQFRKGDCVEVVFGTPRILTIEAIKKTETISKMLVPLDKSMCATHAHILYGNPDYGSFNLLLNSKGCARLSSILVGGKQ